MGWRDGRWRLERLASLEHPSTVSALRADPPSPARGEGKIARMSLPVIDAGDWLSYMPQTQPSPLVCGRRWPSEARSDEGCSNLAPCFGSSTSNSCAARARPPTALP
ncbi:hypothetical protein EN943_03165 [Mesorhizobium sp. M7A.F.Ca.US.006.01.1.1]|nr:hypothetical protein EN943_03165 [Mesorhizobium sp. M7A.F.Ca.US.006.01.1.1]